MINYFSQVIRSQRVKKSLTLINITGLSVCIATALLIILYVWSELSYDSFHNTERVYRVESRLYEGKTLTDNWRLQLTAMHLQWLVKLQALRSMSV